MAKKLKRRKGGKEKKARRGKAFDELNWKRGFGCTHHFLPDCLISRQWLQPFVFIFHEKEYRKYGKLKSRKAEKRESRKAEKPKNRKANSRKAKKLKNRKAVKLKIGKSPKAKKWKSRVLNTCKAELLKS